MNDDTLELAQALESRSVAYLPFPKGTQRQIRQIPAAVPVQNTKSVRTMSALSRNRVPAYNTRSLPLLRLLDRPPLRFSYTLIRSISVESLPETEKGEEAFPICSP